VESVVLYVTIVINVVSLFALIGFVLMHSGKGGGLSDMFGGAAGASLGSTAAERNLNRITTVVAIVWFGTVIALGMLLAG
jgi:preprotein translocase subunit SecG